MGDEPLSLVFSVIPSSEAQEAYDFHQSLAHSNEHLWPRTPKQLLDFANANSLFGVRRTDTQSLVALCYVNRDASEHECEIGGLTVVEEHQKTGIGLMLVRFALAHVMSHDDPWSTGQKLIAHVHQENPKPRRLLEELNFEYAATVPYPGEGFPRAMKRDPNGMVVGDVFHFTRQGLHALAAWFTNEFRGTLKTGAKVQFRLGPESYEDFVAGIQQAAAKYP